MYEGKLRLLKVDYLWMDGLVPWGRQIAPPFDIEQPDWALGLQLAPERPQSPDWPSPANSVWRSARSFLGFEYVAYAPHVRLRLYLPPEGCPTAGGFSVACPIAFFWGVAMLLLFIGVRGWIRYHRWQKQGRCMQCGYDLRASEIRCPECGSEIPSTLQTNDSMAD
jgi:hypothetical protein